MRRFKLWCSAVFCKETAEYVKYAGDLKTVVVLNYIIIDPEQMLRVSGIPLLPVCQVPDFFFIQFAT